MHYNRRFAKSGAWAIVQWTMSESNSSKPRRVAVIGGGITGLSAAFYLQNLAPEFDFVLFEASNRLGGVIQTVREEDSLIELGADNFATLIPDALQLSRDIGLESTLIHPNAEHRFAQIVARGRVHPIPNGFSLMQPTQPWAVLQSPVLSWPGRLRLLKEYFVPARREASDESLEAFATRRLGKEAYERLVEPIIGGIFTAQGSTLSMQAALPQFVEMEAKHGGLIRAALAKRNEKSAATQSAKQASGARYDQFVTHPNGMSAWIAAVADKLPAEKIRLGSRVVALAPTPNHLFEGKAASSGQTPTHRWIVTTGKSTISGPDIIEETLFDAVIVTTPADPAANLLRPIHSVIADQLQQIPYADSAVIAMLVDRAEIDPKLFCFGIVVPQVEKLDTLAVSFTSEKYPGRTAHDKVLLRVFMGGAVRPDLMQESDERLFERGWNDVQRLLKLTKPPSRYRVVRWNQAMPQYLVGHLDRLAIIEKELRSTPTLALAGNGYRGVGIPQCVRSARQAAVRIIEALQA